MIGRHWPLHHAHMHLAWRTVCVFRPQCSEGNEFFFRVQDAAAAADRCSLRCLCSGIPCATVRLVPLPSFVGWRQVLAQQQWRRRRRIRSEETVPLVERCVCYARTPAAENATHSDEWLLLLRWAPCRSSSMFVRPLFYVIGWAPCRSSSMCLLVPFSYVIGWAPCLFPLLNRGLFERYCHHMHLNAKCASVCARALRMCVPNKRWSCIYVLYPCPLSAITCKGTAG